MFSSSSSLVLFRPRIIYILKALTYILQATLLLESHLYLFA